MDGKEIAEMIEREVNVFGCSQKMKDAATNLSYIHRTLQQSLVGNFVIPLVKKLAENWENGCYDPRNESACRMCAAMKDGLLKEFPCMDLDISLPCI